MTDLLYTDIERDLRDSVRTALAKRLDTDRVARLYDTPETDVSDLWGLLSAELGLAGLLVPERLGGAGAGAREAAVVLEELGRTVAPVPFLTSAVIATSVLAAVEDAALESLATGDVTAALVLPWSARTGHWGLVEGSCAPVAGAIGADLFVVPIRAGDDVELRLFTAGEVAVTPVTSLDMSRPLARVELVGSGRVVAAGDRARSAVDTGLLAGAALLASEQYGVAAAALEATVEYARTRIQFARPIGSFQAIKHRLADLYLEVVQAQAAARYAAATLANDDPDRFVAAAVAQAYCSDVAVHATEEGVQLHGGIGMTWEHSMHVFLKRAKSDQLALGTPSRHREDLGALVDLTT